jgi:hypothetical protein
MVLRGFNPKEMKAAMRNKQQSAIAILTSLIQGIDPITGEPLPPDHILNNSDILRSLLAGVSALELTKAREERRAQLPSSVGAKWLPEEDAELVTAYRDSKSVADIAAKHQRTIRAIEARLEKLGILKPEDRSTVNSFLTPRKTKKNK